MSNTDFIQELKERGIVKDTTHDITLSDITSIYCGFDPTADSLHVGSLLPLITMKRLVQAGVPVIALVGGATGAIGDPSFKSEERQMKTMEEIDFCKNSIREQIKDFEPEFKMVDNIDWISKIDMITFLRDFGKHFSVNSMIGKESVKQRISREDQGISFTEFSYMLLQSIDFLKLKEIHNCNTQLGGSDQWGNITSGMELIRKSMGSEENAFGITMPLITKKDGTKFGKSENGTVWLSPEKTTPFQFFQFWLSIEDSEIEKMLKLFSFKSIQEIDIIMEKDRNSGKKPEAQKILAEEMTELVHGKKGLDSALRITDSLFSNSFDSLEEEDLNSLSQEPDFKKIQTSNILEMFVDSGLIKSKKEGRRHIQGNALSINGVKFNNGDIDIKDEHKSLSQNKQFFILKMGKKKVAFVECV